MTRGKEEGVVGKKRKDLPRPFASFPFPSPVVYFLALVPFHARPKIKTSCSSIRFNGNACDAGYNWYNLPHTPGWGSGLNLYRHNWDYWIETDDFHLQPVHPPSLPRSWPDCCVCQFYTLRSWFFPHGLQDTIKKCHAGSGSPRLLHRSENFVPVRNHVNGERPPRGLERIPHA